ncbi:MAG: hypothetical protein OXI79_11545 [Gammaproteobacteria bacterium]|nr:hypothetical protein [Gammaproteobacteria bacterium]
MRKLILAVGGLIAFGGELAIAKSVTCTMASLERTVELRYEILRDAVPCEVRYAKPTEGIGEQVLWRAEREAGYCEARFGEFVDKLRGFGWSCGEATADVTDDWTDAVAADPEPEAAPEVAADEPEATDTDAEEASVPTEPDTADAPTTE